MSTFSIIASPGVAHPRAPQILTPPRRILTPGAHELNHSDAVRWKVLTQIRHWRNADIDWYRDWGIRAFGEDMGKALGEERFFRENPVPDEDTLIPGNMVMASGVAALWQYALNNGTATANTALPTPTLLTNANTYLYVGDGGITAGSGTVSVTNNGATFTFSGAQTTLQGKYVVVSGDSTNGFYFDETASGTAHTMATGYGGTSNGSASWSVLNAESHSQTALQGSTNVASQQADATFPLNNSAAQLNSLTNASNATPIQLTTSGGDISTNDFVHVVEVQGNTNANGIWVANGGSGVSASNIPLLNSTGNGSYTFGGIATKRTIFVVQATFGSSAANFAWYEWGIFNGSGGNKIMINRKVFNGGTKSGGSTALKVGLAIG